MPKSTFRTNYISIGYSPDPRFPDTSHPFAVIGLNACLNLEHQELSDQLCNRGFNFYDYGTFAEQERQYTNYGLPPVVIKKQQCYMWINYTQNRHCKLIVSHSRSGRIMSCGARWSIKQAITVLLSIFMEKFATLKENDILIYTNAAFYENEHIPDKCHYNTIPFPFILFKPDYANEQLVPVTDYATSAYFGVSAMDCLTDYLTLNCHVNPIEIQKELASYGEHILDKFEDAKISLSSKKPIHFCFLGDPGVGKTTLARLGAEYITGQKNKLEIITPSNLKGEYIGHTTTVIFELLKQADEERKVIFIDEAYTMLNDDFGQEAVTLLMKYIDSKPGDCISRPATTEEKKLGNDAPHEYRITGAASIWLAGYETEMRKMLRQNPGLYRRFETIKLNRPTPEQLTEAFTCNFH